jgi:hypothetical protein
MRKTRLFYSDNGNLTDWTIPVGDYKTGVITVSFDPAQDYIYVGNVAPFNHFFFKLGSTANASTATIDMQYWTGAGWQSSIETIDETEGFKKSGFITWIPNRNHGWIRANTNQDGIQVEGLTSIQIYDLYWARIRVSGVVDTGIQIKWLGQKFSDDNDLGSEYPDVVRTATKTAFEAGKTDYEEQAIRAAEVIIADLIKENIIWSKNQVLDRDSFKLPSVCKVAEIIYNAFGDDYQDQKTQSRQEYQSRFKKSLFDVDRNQDGILSIGEMATRMGFATR